MLTRFRMNVQRYPHVFAVILALTAADTLITARHEGLAGLIAEVLVTGTISALAYVWFMRGGRRVSALLNILDLAEGRDVCTIAEHAADETDDEEFCDEEEIYEDEPETEEESEEEDPNGNA